MSTLPPGDAGAADAAVAGHRDPMVGGIEGKASAYGLLFAAVALRLDGRLVAAAACLGASTSFHPVGSGRSSA